MEAQYAMVKLAADEPVTFAKVGIPGFPPLAKTRDVPNMLEDIHAGKLSVEQARGVLKDIKEKDLPYSPFLGCPVLGADALPGGNIRG